MHYQKQKFLPRKLKILNETLIIVVVVTSDTNDCPSLLLVCMYVATAIKERVCD